MTDFRLIVTKGRWRLSMRGCLDGQSRKTDRFIEQSFKGLNSAWASGVFAGSEVTTDPWGWNLSSRGNGTSMDVSARRIP
jgi:hypothetical protein